MAKMGLLGLTACLAIGLGQEGAAVSFDMVYTCHYQPIRVDVLLMAFFVWKWIAWLAGRDGGEAAVAIPTALTAVFVLAPYDVSWIVNQPAMIWLGLVGEATPWAAVAMVWTIWFGIMKGMEWQGERARLVQLGLFTNCLYPVRAEAPSATEYMAG